MNGASSLRCSAARWLAWPLAARAQTATSGGLMPSWSDGPAKQAIIDFVRRNRPLKPQIRAT